MIMTTESKLQDAIIKILMEFPSEPIVQAMRAPDYANRIIAIIKRKGWKPPQDKP